jgi:hypothetical protein
VDRVPAAYRPGDLQLRGHSDHGAPATRLGHRDPAPEQRGDESAYTVIERPTPTSARSSAAARRTRGSRST